MEKLRKSFRKISTRRRTNRGAIDTDSIQYKSSLKNSSTPSALKTPSNTPTVAPSLARFHDDSPIATNKDKEWQEDERLVRIGKSNFKVKYLGYIEVKEPRGMDICENAVSELKKYKKFKEKGIDLASLQSGESNLEPPSTPIGTFIRKMSFRRSGRTRTREPKQLSSLDDSTIGSTTQSPDRKTSTDNNLYTTTEGKKYKLINKKSILWISPDSLRVHEDISRNTLLLDQTIEKVSFCAPDSNHPKLFSYICRDGTTRKWWCYSFSARKNVKGERLSHAVGCAFTACLKRKQDLEKHARAKSVASSSVERDRTNKTNREDKENRQGSSKDDKSNNQDRSKHKSGQSESHLTRSTTDPVLSTVEKRLPVHHDEESEEAKTELTKKKIDEKHPELRKSLRRRPRADNKSELKPFVKQLVADATTVNSNKNDSDGTLSPKSGTLSGADTLTLKSQTEGTSLVPELKATKSENHTEVTNGNKNDQTKNLSLQSNSTVGCDCIDKFLNQTSNSCDKSSVIDNDSLKGLTGSKYLQSMSKESAENHSSYTLTNNMTARRGSSNLPTSNSLMQGVHLSASPLPCVPTIPARTTGPKTLVTPTNLPYDDRGTESVYRHRPGSVAASIATTADPVLQPVKSIDTILNSSLKLHQHHPVIPARAINTINQANSNNHIENAHKSISQNHTGVSINSTGIKPSEWDPWSADRDNIPLQPSKPETPILQPVKNHTDNITSHQTSLVKENPNTQISKSNTINTISLQTPSLALPGSPNGYRPQIPNRSYSESFPTEVMSILPNVVPKATVETNPFLRDMQQQAELKSRQLQKNFSARGEEWLQQLK